MTFEEFFLKKKIDLDSLKLGKPDVFAEFVAHYEVMSEKSFDHTKKYWFNNLRIAYPLSEEKELSLKESFKHKAEEVLASNENSEKLNEIPSVAAIKSRSFKPRFKAPVNPEESKPAEVAAEKPGISEAAVSAPKPSGFKPRFKTGAPKPVVNSEEETKSEITNGEISTEEKSATAKPAGFKPRFKAGVTKPVIFSEEVGEVKSEVVKEETSTEEKTAIARPAGFKPRFKAGVTKPVAVMEEVEESKQEVTKDETPIEEKPVVAKPVGFKPRFKAPKKEE